MQSKYFVLISLAIGAAIPKESPCAEIDAYVAVPTEPEVVEPTATEENPLAEEEIEQVAPVATEETYEEVAPIAGDEGCDEEEVAPVITEDCVQPTEEIAPAMEEELAPEINQDEATLIDEVYLPHSRRKGI